MKKSKSLLLFVLSVIIMLNVMGAPAVYALDTDELTSKTENTGQQVDVKDYYCKKTIYNASNINEYEKIHINQRKSIDEEILNGGEIFSACNYEYYVSDVYNKNGDIIDSYVLSDAEVLELNSGKLNTLAETTATSNGLLGNDFEDTGKLYIGIVVIKYSDGSYHVISNAEWKTDSKIGGKNYPDAAGDDFFAVTWGGKGELQGTITKATGFYQNQKTMKISKAKSDSYKGYCWRFLEKSSGLGSCMKGIYTELNIKKANKKKLNKKTNVKCTYIHTYSKVTGSISFSGGTNGVAYGITLSKTEAQWPLECDVPGLVY